MPVYLVHGWQDRTLPVRFTGSDVVVPRGGHLPPLTHPAEVNAFLRQGMRDDGRAFPRHHY